MCIQAERVFNMKLLTSLLDAWKTAAKGLNNIEVFFLLYIDFLSKIWCYLSFPYKLNMYSIWNFSPCFSTPGKQQQKIRTTWSLYFCYTYFLSKIWCCLIKFSIHVKLNMYSIWNYSPCFSTPGKQQQKVCTTWSLFVCLQFLFNNVCRLHYQPALQLLFEKLWEREVNKCSLVF